MAKVRGPLHSLSASGKIGGSLRYRKDKGRATVGKNKSKAIFGNIKLERQSAIVSMAAEQWQTVTGRGPESTYTDYLRQVSNAGYFFWAESTLLTWTFDQVMTTGEA